MVSDPEDLRSRLGLTGALVLAAGDGVVPGPGLAELALQVLQRPGLQVGAGLDPEGVHPARRRRTDAVELGHRQGLDERLALLGRDRELAVGLALAGGELGQELVVGDPGRGGEAGLLRGSGRGSPWRSARRSAGRRWLAVTSR